MHQSVERHVTAKAPVHVNNIVLVHAKPLGDHRGVLRSEIAIL
jgi:hypothetical protein